MCDGISSETGATEVELRQEPRKGLKSPEGREPDKITQNHAKSGKKTVHFALFPAPV